MRAPLQNTPDTPELHTPEFFTGFAAIAALMLLWLGACILVDGVMMPTMAAAGMPEQPGFAAAGYRFFSTFNRLELLAGASALVGTLAAWKLAVLRGGMARLGSGLAGALALVAAIDTYVLTPHLSGLSLDLSALPAVPSAPLMPFSPTMMVLQSTYWGLEGLKLMLAVGLLALCWRSLTLSRPQLTH